MFFQLVVLIFEKLVIVVLQCTFCFKKTEDMSSFRVGLHPSWSSTYDFPSRFVHFFVDDWVSLPCYFCCFQPGGVVQYSNHQQNRQVLCFQIGEGAFLHHWRDGSVRVRDPGGIEGRRGNEWPLLPRKKRTTPRKTNMEPLKRDYFSREYIFQPLIFRGVMLVFRGVGGGFNDLFIFTLTWGNDPID